jgi:hypothetical protein
LASTWQALLLLSSPALADDKETLVQDVKAFI